VQKRTRVSRDEWAKPVERWRDSGLTTAEFAAELGINPHSLTYSAWTLKREARGQKRVWPKKSRSQAVARKVTVSSTPFVDNVRLKIMRPTSNFVYLAAAI
jgi:hypothetical protein